MTTAKATGTSTTTASATSRAHWPVSPAMRRADDAATRAAGSSCSGAPRTSPAGSATGVSAGIVGPPVQQRELRGRDGQGDEEQPDGVHGPDADVVGPVEPVDLVDERLGGRHRPALGQ